MHCIRALKMSHTTTGDITYHSRSAEIGLQSYDIPCRKCLPCRLNLAREKAIRCWHESRMHNSNIFLTLTYSDENLKSEKLQIRDIQLFLKRLREQQTRDVTDKYLLEKLYIPVMYTGEYGDEHKRPHWHLLLFNYDPGDLKFNRTTKRGDKIYTSERIEKLWGFNDSKQKPNEIGEITLESAGYVARYAAKKLIHGKDQEHDWHPIHKTSSRRAIGRSWIEKYYKQTFNNGFITLPNGQTGPIPRYYVDWAKKYQPDIWKHYVIEVRPKAQKHAEQKKRKEELEFFNSLINYTGKRPLALQRKTVKLRVLESKFKQLQSKLKGDI